MQNCRRRALDKIVSTDRQTDEQLDMKIAYAQLHKHTKIMCSEEYLQKCRSNAMDNND